MADDPITISGVEIVNICAGLRMITGLATGGADYNASGGMVMDLSAYGDTVHGAVMLSPHDETAATVKAEYIPAASGAAATGYVWVGWIPAIGSSGAGDDYEAAQAFEEITDTTNLSTYAWHFTAFMSGATA